MAVYLASVILAFEADNAADAADAVSAMLTENLMQAPDCLLDWSYTATINETGHYVYSDARRSAVPADEVKANGFGTDMNTAFDEATPEQV